MQICISVNTHDHPNLFAKIQDIKWRGGSVSGELAVLMEKTIGEDIDKIDQLTKIVDEMTRLMSAMRTGITLVNDDVIHENTQDMLGNMMFGFADDE